MRKNILILAHNYGTQFVESCNQYSQLFDREKYHVTVAFLTGEPDDAIVQKTHAETLFLNCPQRKIRGLKLTAVRRVYQLCRAKKFDIVICHRFKPTHIMLWVARLIRFRAVICVMHAINTMQNLARKFHVAALARNNIIFAGVSDAVCDDLRRSLWFVSSQRIMTLHNILDWELYEPRLLSREAARQALQLSSHDFIFGHMARFTEDKDQKSLISAFALLKAECPQAKLVMVGHGKLESALKAQVHALKLEKDVIFTGFLAEGFTYMKAFDAFVLSSVKESFGRVLLEAMMAKVPLIGTSAGGIPEVIGDVGFIAQAENPNHLAEIMQRVYYLSETERHAQQEKGYQRILNHFSLQRFREVFWQLPLIKNEE